jgi:hypothetical protein
MEDMTTITITPQYVNPPKEGKKWGNIKDENGNIYLGPWPLVSQAQKGVLTDIDVEVEFWKDKQGGPDQQKYVVKGVALAGQMPLQTTVAPASQMNAPQPAPATLPVMSIASVPVQAAPAANGQHSGTGDPFAGLAHELPVPTGTPQTVAAQPTVEPLRTAPISGANGARIGMFFNLMKESHIQGVDLPDDEQLIGWYKWAQGMSAKIDG